MNWDFIQENIPLYQEAFLLTIRLAFLGILGSLVIGSLISLIRYFKIPLISKVAGAYIELSRNTPLLIQLFFLYFGLPKIGLTLSSEACAIIGLIFLGGSYMAESFRSGMEAISLGQKESATALGLKSWQVFVYIIWPQALAISLPSISANVIFLIKETSVFSIVALADLMYVAKELIGIYYETDEALLMLVVSYLIILLPLSIILSLIERRLRYAGFGSTSSLSGK
ncbi:amino acid ABC transporter permease [Streptococcus hillyeri]|uniref:Amino acid ABC transporter permease n=1 Tax=Streptococcus hillyeri TaxID=2282420 RepID=A0A3L9DUB4_9STRE|nr:amino acid ABC transporter permease [Streptococcus hillyeri]RLY03944.1 amino acid ABC transporter permease [Streptococcus hillyeri]